MTTEHVFEELRDAGMSSADDSSVTDSSYEMSSDSSDEDFAVPESTSRRNRNGRQKSSGGGNLSQPSASSPTVLLNDGMMESETPASLEKPSRLPDNVTPRRKTQPLETLGNLAEELIRHLLTRDSDSSSVQTADNNSSNVVRSDRVDENFSVPGSSPPPCDRNGGQQTSREGNLEQRSSSASTAHVCNEKINESVPPASVKKSGRPRKPELSLENKKEQNRALLLQPGNTNFK